MTPDALWDALQADPVARAQVDAAIARSAVETPVPDDPAKIRRRLIDLSRPRDAAGNVLNGRTRAGSKVVHAIVQGGLSRITGTMKWVHACGASLPGHSSSVGLDKQSYERSIRWWKPLLLTLDPVTCPKCRKALDGR